MEDRIMKKVFSYALIAISAISVLSSCNKEIASPESDAVCADGPSFVAVLDDGTKTTIDGSKIYWNDGDCVSVNGSIFVAAVDPENKSRALFTMKQGETAPAAVNGLYHIYYPASSYVANNPARFKLGGTQTYAGEDISNVNPMYAQVASLDDQAQFKNVCGLLAVKAKGTDKIATVAVTAPTSNYLYGTISNLAYNEGAISYSTFQASGRGTTVTLDCGKGVQLKSDEATTFYIALPEKDYSKLTIAFTTTDGKKKSFASAKACPVKKSNIYGIPEIIDFSVNFDATIEITRNEAVSAGSAELGFTITPTDQNVYYVYCCETKSYVDSFNGDDAALANADLLFYKNQGITTLNAFVSYGLATKGTKNLTASAAPGSDMYVYAFGIDSDLNVSPAIKVPVKVAEFSLPGCSAQYSDYLGQWKLGNSIITVSEKENGLTYNVTGLKNQDSYSIPAIEASFDNGNFILCEQKTSATTSVGNYGLCDLYLSGVFVQGAKSYGYFPINSSTKDDPQMIFYGQFENDKITVYPGGCKYGTFSSMGFSWVIRSGAYAGNGNTFSGNALEDMTKYEAPVCDAQYSDYIGEWVCGTDILKIEEKVNGSTYNVTGIKNQSKYSIPAVEAYFENGNFILKEQSTSATTTVGSYGLCDLYLSAIEDVEDGFGNYPFMSSAPDDIFIGQYKDGMIKVIPNYPAMGFSWVIRSGENAGGGNTYPGTTIVDMTKYEAPTGPTPEGTWYCAEGVDLWDEPFADWTINIRTVVGGYEIDGFDITFAEYNIESPMAEWNAADQTLTIAAGTLTGLSLGTDNLLWVGLDEEMSTTDIVLKVDFDAKTITNQTAWGAVCGQELYSGYPAGGCVFVKQEAAPAGVKAASIKNSSRNASLKELQPKLGKRCVNSESAVPATIREFNGKRAVAGIR